MAPRIPAKIKPYQGLVAAWKARHGSSGKSVSLGYYDPPRKRRRNTPSRRSTRHKRPKRRSMKRGYGTIKRKPYGVGSRGGVYWSGGRKPRYDPSRRRNYKRRAKTWFGKAMQKLDQYAPLLGFGMFLGFPMWASYKRYMDEFGESGGNFWRFLWDGARNEINNLLGLYGEEGTFTPTSFLQWKFTHPHSVWSKPFFISLGTWLACKFGLVDIVLPHKYTKIIHKISFGGLIASIIGGLFILGAHKENPQHQASKPSYSDSYRATSLPYG